MKDKLSFYQFLFRTAFCFMACDGHIDDREIAEIRRLADSTRYFKGVEVEEELRLLMEAVKREGRRIFRHYLDDLAKHEYDVVQELMLLEVALRVIHIDARVDPNEIKLIRLLRSRLQVPNEIILQRFGTVDLLMGDKKLSGATTVIGVQGDDLIPAGRTDADFKLLDVDWAKVGKGS